MKLDEPITYKHAFGWVVAAAVALISLGFTFGNSIVSRAEASSTRVEDRLDKRLERIEKNVDILLQRSALHAR